MAEMNMSPREKARLEEEKKNRKTRNKFILVGVIVVFDDRAGDLCELAPLL